MAEVNPVTGYPKEESGKEGVDRFNRLNDQKAKADQLRDEISSGEGQVILNKIKEHLLARVNKLIDEDAECRALKRLLVDMGVTINIGEKAIEGLMRLLMKRQAQ